MSTKDARHQVYLYVTLVFICSYLLQWIMISRGGISSFGNCGIFSLMWVPGVIALIFKWIYRNNLPALGWARPSFSQALISYLLPLFACIVIYGIAWSSGLASLVIPWEGIARKLMPGYLGFSLLFLYTASWIFVQNTAFALGEEIGWRGLLLPLLFRAKIPHPLLISGIIWGFWHLPLILFGGYTSGEFPLISALIFMIMVISAGTIIGWLRLSFNSLWPAVIFHASHNTFLQSFFDRLTSNSPYVKYIIGESGILTMVIYIIIAFYIIHFKLPSLRHSKKTE